MDFFEKNMSVFRKAKTELYEGFVKKRKQRWQTDISMETFVAKDGTKVFAVKKNGKRFRLNSAYHPVEEADKWCSQYDFTDSNINILMFGIGGLLFIRKLLANMHQDTKIYLYEPSIEIFDYMMHEADMTDILSRQDVYLYLVGVNERNFYYDLGKRTHWSNINAQIDSCHPKYDILFPEEYKEFREQIIRCDTTAVVNKNTNIRFSESFTKNALRNIPYILNANSIFDYIGKFPAEMPAIIVSAGPSLDQNIHLLRQAEGKSFIIATDTAIGSLVREHIAIDCIVTIDPEKPMEYLMFSEVKNIPLFCGLNASADFLRYHTGKKIWFRDSGTYLADLYRKFQNGFPELHAGANVAAGAWTICRVLGFRHIVLVGQDLAYKDGKNHAGGINNVTYLADGKLDSAELWVEGIDGKPVKTRGDWKIYLKWFEQEIATYKDEIETIDATEGGALIHGTKIMSMQEVLKVYCKEEFSVRNIFETIPPSFVENRKQVEGYLLHMEKEVAYISSRAKEVLNIIEQVILILRNPIVDYNYLAKRKEELLKTSSDIMKQPVYALLMQYIDGKSVKITEELNDISGNTQADHFHIMELYKEYYQIVQGVIEEMMPFIKQTVAIIKNENP